MRATDSGVSHRQSGQAHAGVKRRPVLEAGLHRPGAEGGNVGAGAFELPVHRFRQGQDEGLGGVVDRHVRPRLEGGGGGDVEHPAPAVQGHGPAP